MQSACADLDEINPINSIPAESAINSSATAQAALNGAYSSLQDGNFDKWLSLPQYFSDETIFTGTFPTRLEFGNFNVFPSNGTMAGVFSGLYTTINNANNVIELIPVVEDLSAEQKTDFVAQARFIRAVNYLHLVTLWQEVPLVTMPTEDVGDILNVPVSSVDEIYALIIADFTEAAQNVAADTGPTTASKQAANAYLARVALYREDWGEAIARAQQALDGVDVSTVPYLQDQIYTLGFTATDGNSLNFFYGPADFGGRHSIEPSQTLIGAFEPGDLRMDATVDLVSASVPYGVKYPSFDAGSSGTATDPIYFIRHAEMALIVAEVAAEMGDFETANTHINQVRARAGLGPVTLDASNFVDLILQERFVEFGMEGPFRLLDLRRRNRVNELLAPLGYDACDNVWPLPQRDVDRNPNLTQNGCCNC